MKFASQQPPPAPVQAQAQAAAPVQAASWAQPPQQPATQASYAATPPQAGTLMSAFNPTAAPQGTAPSPMAGMRHSVTYGIAGYDVDTEADSVIINLNPAGTGGVLVIGVDVNSKGQRFKPKDGPEQIVIRVDSGPTLYLVESMGVRFEHKGEVLTQYMIVQIKTLNAP